METKKSMGAVVFVTGTDTGVGKTLFTALLLSHVRSCGVNAFAVKPVCSGSTSDVRILHSIQNGELAREEINPVYVPFPVAPVAIPTRMRPKIRLAKLVDHVRSVQYRCEILIVEGFGGLLAPIEHGLVVRDLIFALGGAVIVVARNRLGAINHTLLTAECLKGLPVSTSITVLMDANAPSLVEDSNERVLRKLLAPRNVVRIPFLGRGASSVSRIKSSAEKLKKTLALVWKKTIF